MRRGELAFVQFYYFFECYFECGHFLCRLRKQLSFQDVKGLWKLLFVFLYNMISMKSQIKKKPYFVPPICFAWILLFSFLVFQRLPYFFNLLFFLLSCIFWVSNLASLIFGISLSSIFLLPAPTLMRIRRGLEFGFGGRGCKEKGLGDGW